MELIIRIHQGQILVGSARGGDTEKFSDEGAAAAHVAYKTVQKCQRRSYDASWEPTSRGGRPAFNRIAFEARVQQEVRRLRRSVSSLAA